MRIRQWAEPIDRESFDPADYQLPLGCSETGAVMFLRFSIDYDQDQAGHHLLVVAVQSVVGVQEDGETRFYAYASHRHMGLADTWINGPDPSLLRDLELANMTTIGAHEIRDQCAMPPSYGSFALVDKLCEWISSQMEIEEQFLRVCGSRMSYNDAVTIQEDHGGIVYRDGWTLPNGDDAWRWTENQAELVDHRPDLGEIPLSAWLIANWDESLLMAKGGEA